MSSAQKRRPIPTVVLAILVVGVLAGCASSARSVASKKPPAEKEATLAQVRSALHGGKPVFIELGAPW